MDAKPARLDSVDFLRGIVMILMALDHVRDFFHWAHFDPLDLTQTTPLLYATRWITHFCAPTFIFLAGTGAFLSTTRGKTTRELSGFLFTRGLFLVVLEVTVVRFAWLFSPDYSLTFVQVIWAIGWSMVFLSALIHLPRWGMASVAGALILFHNAFDRVDPGTLGIFGWPWQILHVQSPIEFLPGKVLFVAYPLIPWIAVMASGYLFGPLLLREATQRRSILVRLGLGLIALFVVLRWTNIYGNPIPWSTQATPLLTFLSFMNVEKYPPSLLYLCATLGPAILLLSFLERWKGAAADAITIFGRVPMFYYVAHLYLIHLLAIVAALLTVGDASFLWSLVPPWARTASYGFSLGTVYLVWIGVVAALYYPCRWFAGVKKRSTAVWLSYL